MDRVESQRRVCGWTGWKARGKSMGGQSGSWRSACGWTGWKLEVSLWVDRVEVGGQSVGGQDGSLRLDCGWTGLRLEVSLWLGTRLRVCMRTGAK